MSEEYTKNILFHSMTDKYIFARLKGMRYTKKQFVSAKKKPLSGLSLCSLRYVGGKCHGAIPPYLITSNIITPAASRYTK